MHAGTAVLIWHGYFLYRRLKHRPVAGHEHRHQRGRLQSEETFEVPLRVCLLLGEKLQYRRLDRIQGMGHDDYVAHDQLPDSRGVFFTPRPESISPNFF